jgi:hypothetical protein
VDAQKQKAFTLVTLAGRCNTMIWSWHRAIHPGEVRAGCYSRQLAPRTDLEQFYGGGIEIWQTGYGL